MTYENANTETEALVPAEDEHRVFLLETTRRQLDVSSAERFGVICYLFNENVRRPSVFNSQQYIEAVVDELHNRDFNVEKDYFIIAGSMVNISLAMLALAAYAGDRPVKLLMFDSNAGHYVDKEIVTLERA